MLRPFRLWKYKKEVKSFVLSYLAFVDRDAAAALSREYPWLDSRIEDLFQKETPPAEAGLLLARLIWLDLIDNHMTDQQRLEALEEFLSGKPLRDKVGPGGRLALALRVAEDTVRDSNLSQLALKSIFHDIVGSLQGKRAVERSNERIAGALLDGLFNGGSGSDELKTAALSDLLLR